MRHFLLVFLLVLGACRSLERVPLDPALALEVRTRMGSTRDGLPVLYLDPAPRLATGAIAVCYDDHIVIAADGLAAFEFHVTHELVHWYADDSPFVGLPHFVEEGLADWIACDVAGVREERMLESHLIGSLRIERANLYGDAAGWQRLPLNVTHDLTRAGFDLIRRLGLDRVRALALEGASVEELLAAAGITD